MTKHWNYIKNILIDAYKNNPIMLFILCVLSGFMFMGLAPFTGAYSLMLNDYFDMGKAVLDGAVTYRDIMAHTGVYAYVPYAIMAFISRTSYVHINIINFVGGVLVGLHLFYICRRYDAFCKLALLTSIVTVILILMRSRVFCPVPFFYSEMPLFFMIPFLLYYINSGKYLDIVYRDWFMFGVVFGLAIAVKYSLMVIYFPFWLSMVSYYAIHAKQYSVGKILKANGVAIIGCLCALLPWMLYLTVHGLWRDVFIYYFGYVSAGSIMPVYYILSGLLSAAVIIYHGKYLNLLLFVMEIAMCMLATGGAKNEYTMVLLLLFIPSIVLSKNYSLLVNIICVVGFLFILLYAALHCREQYLNMCEGAFDQSVESIGEEYGITNDDVMYIGEDTGFGTMRSETGLYSYQWVGDKFYLSDDVENIMFIQKDAITRHKYKTICVNEYILSRYYDRKEFNDLIQNSGYVKKRDYYNYLGQKNTIYQLKG